MLAIRLQRTGRRKYAQYRVVVQEAQRTPTSGRVVASIGSYNPHTKEVVIDKDKAKYYLKNGAQPSDAIIRLLKSEKVSLPKWATPSSPQNKTTRNPEKLRKNQPKEEAAENESNESAEKTSVQPEEKSS